MLPPIERRREGTFFGDDIQTIDPLNAHVNILYDQQTNQDSMQSLGPDSKNDKSKKRSKKVKQR